MQVIKYVSICFNTDLSEYHWLRFKQAIYDSYKNGPGGTLVHSSKKKKKKKKKIGHYRPGIKVSDIMKQPRKTDGDFIVLSFYL